MPKIDVKELSVIYGDKKNKDGIVAIDNLSLTFENGSFNVILGPSGSGKTTLIQTIIGLLPYYGDVFFDGVNASKIKIPDRDLSYVSQEYVLYPSKSIFDNIALPLKIKGCEREEIIERVYEIANYYGLAHCLFRKPKHLSGGQQQKVAICRALVKDSSLYLFDEPFSNIAANAREEEARQLKEYLKKIKATVIYVTHDIKEAYLLADKIFVLDKGKLVEKGSVEEINKSMNEIVSGLRRASFDGNI